MNSKAFVFTGTVFLLVIPAVILAASFVNMLEFGSTATVTSIRSDLVFYAHNDIKSNFEKTGCNLIDIYGSNTSAIRQYLNSTWSPFIEQNYTGQVGVLIDLPENRINVSNDAQYRRIQIGNLNTSQGIPLNVTDLNSEVSLNLSIGPLLSSYNNPPSMPTLLFPISGWTTNNLTQLLNWSDSSDPENDNITYQVEVGAATNYTRSSNITVARIDGTYTWRAKATDGIENLTFTDVCGPATRSNWTATWNFTVNVSALSLTLLFVEDYPCRVSGGGEKPMRVEANVTSQGNPITDASVTVELIMGGALIESDTMDHIGGGIYGEGSTYWESDTGVEKNDFITVRVTAMRTGYVSAMIELTFKANDRKC